MMFLNLSPLINNQDYRYLYLGQFISLIGNMLTYVALPYQVYHLTHSSLAVGNIGLVQLIPLLITSLWGGALADKIDRKKLLLYAEFGMALMSFLLLVNAKATVPKLWLVYLVAGCASALSGFHRPTLEALTQELVNKDDMPAISALTSFRFGVTTVLGPSLAGLLLAKFNLSIVYCIDLLSYLGSIVAILAIHISVKQNAKEVAVLESIKQGLQYAVSRPELIGSYAIDFIAMVFGMPIALFPAIADHYYSVKYLGWLYAAPSIGLLLASIFSGWTRHIYRHGAAIAIAASLWGLAIIAFGFATNIVLAIFFLMLAGAADEISALFRMTLWNQTIPQNYRGRLAGIEMISYMSGPLLGNAEAGLVAAAFNTQVSIVSGGMLCMLGVFLLVLTLPRFWKYSLQQNNN